MVQIGSEVIMFEKFQSWALRFPSHFLDFMSQYFRLEVSGAQHLPKKGSFILASNHSGFSGLDAMILAHKVKTLTGRSPRVMTHMGWFLSPITARPLKKFGFIEAKMEYGLKVLRKHQSLLIFPEGEKGNFKASHQAYELQPFKTGAVRLALKTKCPLIPVLILGAEESQINLKQLQLSRNLKKWLLPLPLNLIPLPTRWHIIILPPIELPFSQGSETRTDLIQELSAELQELMQKALHDQLKKRHAVF